MNCPVGAMVGARRCKASSTAYHIPLRFMLSAGGVDPCECPHGSTFPCQGRWQPQADGRVVVCAVRCKAGGRGRPPLQDPHGRKSVFNRTHVKSRHVIPFGISHSDLSRIMRLGHSCKETGLLPASLSKSGNQPAFFLCSSAPRSLLNAFSLRRGGTACGGCGVAYPAFLLCSSISSLSATSAINSPFVGLSFLP